MTPKEKFFLFKQSKNFCSVPWNHVKIDTDGSILTCVNGKYNLGNIKEHNIDTVLNTPDVVKLRENLRQDLPDTNCLHCKRLENTQDYSYRYLRDLYNSTFLQSTADYDNANDFVLNGIDLHWSSTCNLKCIMCWSKQSSSIAQEMGEPIRHVPAAAAQKIIDFVVGNQHTLKEIYLSGGEPTLIKHNLNLLRSLRKDLDFLIRINTNLTFSDNNPILQELKKFPRVLFTISADVANREKFNYIRRGAEWDVFVKNLTQLKKTHFTWRVNSVFFVATALHLPDTQEYFMKNFDIHDFTINQVELGHTNLQCRNLSDSLKQQAIIKLTSHKQKYQHNKNLEGQLANCLIELQRPAEESYENFFNDIDVRADTDWKKTFWELQ